MAQKIRVKGSQEGVTKNAARCLVRRLLARWTIRGREIERLEVRPADAAALTRYVPGLQPKAYIPPTLPFAELPGIIVEHPKNRARFVLGMIELRPCDE